MVRNLLLIFVGTIIAVPAMAQWDSRESADDNFAPSTKVSFEESNLPLVFINTNSQVIQHKSKILARMKIIDNGDGHNYRDTTTHSQQTVDYDGYITLKYRGNSSFYSSKKKPFAVRPLKADKVAKDGVNAKKDKVSIMGMAKDNDWALLAPWEDKSYMRDVITMKMARGSHTFASEMKYCEVIVDGVYYGVYIMSERATKGKSRLNIDDVSASDMSGEFHVEIDRDDEDHYYQSSHAPVMSDGTEISGKKITYQYKSPEYEDFADLPAGTEDSIHAAIDAMENAFASADYKDSLKGYRQYIDVASFIDHEIAVEVSNNIDGYRLSSPLYKHSRTRAKELGDNDRWKTALWDFNIAYGNASYYSPGASGIWRYTANDVMYNADNQLVPFFWYKLMTDESYVNELKQRYTQVRKLNYSENSITSRLDSLQQVLTANGAADRDNEAWSNHFGTLSSEKSTLLNYIKNRLKFLDAGWLITESGGDSGNDDDNKQTTAQPLAVKEGFNIDAVCEDAANIASTITINSEAKNNGFDVAGFVYYAQGASSSLTDGYLCDSEGNLSSSNATYKINVSKTSVLNNSLTLKGSDATGDYAVSSGTLTLQSPVKTSKIYIAGLSADGENTLAVTVNYSDGTSSSGSIHFSNWDTTDDNAFKSTLRRMASAYVSWSRTNAGETQGDAKFQVMEQSVETDAAKSVVSIKFERGSEGGHPSVLALAYVPTATGITSPQSSSDNAVTAIYTAGGIRVKTPQRGINIIRYADGSVRKVIVK